MTLCQFNELVGPCSDKEIDRLRTRYQPYYREHRQVFIDFLRGKFSDDREFKQALLEARIKASAAGKTSAETVETLTRTSSGGFGHANERKFIKLATRILYLRMTSGSYRTRDGRIYEPWPLPCDDNPTIKPATAKHQLVEIMKPWALGYEGIRKQHTPFQDDA
ncbi:MAG: hypothetical protein IIA07_10880 [Proteobacteria bacterium]|nr:hypothetical protein [Pseudomonadota bacterium]